jgi:hypothetical protein
MASFTELDLLSQYVVGAIYVAELWTPTLHKKRWQKDQESNMALEVRS